MMSRRLVFLIFHSTFFSFSKNQSDVLFDKFIQARNAKSDDAALTMLVADKLWTFVKSRALKWKVNDSFDLMVSAGDKGKINVGVSVDAKRAFIEGRGKMKNSGPLIAAVIFKGALLGILAFKLLFLLSGKALLVSKLAFLLSSLIGVKKLLSQKQKVRKPIKSWQFAITIFSDCSTSLTKLSMIIIAMTTSIS